MAEINFTPPFCHRCQKGIPDVTFCPSAQWRCRSCISAVWKIKSQDPIGKQKRAAYVKRRLSITTKRAREWRQANPIKAKAIRDRYREASPSANKESKRKWKANNAPKAAEYARRRRALKLGCDVESIASVYELIRNAEKIRCYWCRKFVSLENRHVDHIVPISKGGPHVPHNLCCSCSKCNLSKGAKMPEEFNGQAVLGF